MKNPLIISLDFASFEVYDYYIISSIKEGVSLSNKHLKKIFEIFNQYFEEKPFISIANREHDYNIDPNLLKSKKHPSLVGIAVVCYNQQSKEIAKFEKSFYHGPFEIFNSLDEAISWGKMLLNTIK